LQKSDYSSDIDIGTLLRAIYIEHVPLVGQTEDENEETQEE
jgi:hypothetical protein